MLSLVRAELKWRSATKGTVRTTTSVNTFGLPFKNLRLPLIQAPMFLVSNPKQVVASCINGIVGTFPALNARSTDSLDQWIHEIIQKKAENENSSDFGVNLIVHKTNSRIEADLEVLVKHRVPLVITSLGAVKDIINTVHRYGGLVFHDVTTIRHAEKAVEAGVDGLILVCAGAGGHAGTASPFAFLAEVRKFFSGIIVLAGALSTGSDILAARVMGADMAYMGTRFISIEVVIL
eukprot:TRINITY_DN7243_c0_g3_i2.p1 TRINITY_DN7243_c0_g3~~TRINITY_DN7243_c0_g3_i2.p1  ORF type:complete len:235 (-),score=56.28 TRINITY_DN7243_c0_g3_i2:950-1654(-)